MTNIAYLTNAHPESGVGYRAERLRQELASKLTIEEFRIDGAASTLKRNGEVLLQQRYFSRQLHPKTLAWLTLGFRLRSLLHRTRHHRLWHATNQTLSFIITPDIPSVVTVHDIIEVLEPQTRLGGLAAHYLYRGIPRATHLIAVSKFTARTLMEHYTIPQHRITIIPNGVGSEFHPIPHFSASVGCQTLRQELKLEPKQQVLLYVGSDHPRKNVQTVVEVLAQLRRIHPELILVKVGLPGLATGREILLARIDELHLRHAVRFVGQVSYSRLNELYNMADVLLYPTRFEGFGLPPLQAFAAGLPVVTSNTTALPEVVGEAALTADPYNIDALTQHADTILSNPTAAAALREKGLARAKLFTWESAAQQELAVYQKVLKTSR